MNFKITYLDWTIVISYLLLMLWLGYNSSKKNKNVDDYLLGGKSMNPFMIGISLFATLFSTLSYLSYPGEMIKYGPVFLAGLLAFPVSSWIIGKFLIPKFMHMRVKSAYEILEIKLGAKTRRLAVLFFLSLRLLWMTTIIYAAVDSAFVPIFNLDRSLVPLISIALTLLTIIYTTMGGLNAVVKTDVAQSIIMFLGLIVSIVFIINQLGSVQSVFDTTNFSHWDPLEYKINPIKRMTIGNIFIMTLVWQVCTAGSDQLAIQRYLSTKDVKTAKKSYNISLWGSTLIQILLAITGLCVMAYFRYNPTKMEIGKTIFDNSDSLFPLFIRIGLPTGLTGLIAAAIIAAAMSSLSSGLNSCSAVISEETRKRNKNSINSSDSSDLKFIKKISIIIGIIVALSSFFIPFITGNLFDVIQKVVNLVVAPLFVLFFMALFVPFATDRATALAGLFSLIIAIFIAFFEMFGISSLWIMTLSLLGGIILGVLFSYMEVKISIKK